METMINKTVNDQAIIKLQVLDYDYKANKAIVQLEIKEPGQRKFRFKIIEGVYVVPEIKSWLMKSRDIKNEDGEIIGNMTGFQRYCEKNGLKPVLKDLVFESKNTDENYSLNPFRLVKNKNGKWSLQFVNRPIKKRIAYINPINNEEIGFKYVNPSNANGYMNYLAPKYYRRLQVNTDK